MNSDHQEISPAQKPDVHRYIQQAYTYFAQGDIEGAIAHFHLAISLAPQCAEIYTARAKFRQQKLGDHQGALEDYTKAIGINPDNAFFYYWRSQTYQKLGNQQKAIEDYNAAMNLAPEGTIYHLFDHDTNRL
ncbi:MULTISPECIES: tetratricopeptide repeat protein [unclassified Anabaena]|uniref:tetratricopeptide repeat protein n=1 Tax=unclassified Anabaena TaxID=2619674 RepID=UPI000833AA10|nr:MULTISPECIES: tetratricopeptide repeat protein [unclassified Anabaena]